ncbi:hypothetical protein D1007_41649 [Hordeum vulgare]|nr:hypothetical protein D1007_41649 [Hordeum vulgare]
MEKMEGMLRSMRLLEAKKAGLRIGGKGMEAVDGERTTLVESRAVGKVLLEKEVSAEGLIQAVGKNLCPLRSIRCRKMGENIFLFTFLQASGKKKALDSGPWVLNNDLVVVVDFDPNKALEEYVFSRVPI